MIVERANRNRVVSFSSIASGCAFVIGERIYMKIKESADANAVCLDDGNLNFVVDDFVTFVNAKVVVE